MVRHILGLGEFSHPLIEVFFVFFIVVFLTETFVIATVEATVEPPNKGHDGTSPPRFPPCYSSHLALSKVQDS